MAGRVFGGAILINAVTLSVTMFTKYSSSTGSSATSAAGPARTRAAMRTARDATGSNAAGRSFSLGSLRAYGRGSRSSLMNV